MANTFPITVYKYFALFTKKGEKREKIESEREKVCFVDLTIPRVLRIWYYPGMSP